MISATPIAINTSAPNQNESGIFFGNTRNRMLTYGNEVNGRSHANASGAHSSVKVLDIRNDSLPLMLVASHVTPASNIYKPPKNKIRDRKSVIFFI